MSRFDYRNSDIDYEKYIRFAARIAGVVMLYISAMFSKDGFSFSNPNKQWVGWAFAVIVIVVEFVWNKRGAKHGVTLYVCGWICYCYGLYTNILGIMVGGGAVITGTGFAFLGSFLSNALTHPVALFGGAMLELLPEPMLIWSFTGESAQSDPVGHMLDARQGIQSKTETAQEERRQGLGKLKHNIPTATQHRSQPANSQTYYRPAPKPATQTGFLNMSAYRGITPVEDPSYEDLPNVDD